MWAPLPRVHLHNSGGAPNPVVAGLFSMRAMRRMALRRCGASAVRSPWGLSDGGWSAEDVRAAAGRSGTADREQRQVQSSCREKGEQKDFSLSPPPRRAGAHRRVTDRKVNEDLKIDPKAK